MNGGSTRHGVRGDWIGPGEAAARELGDPDQPGISASERVGRLNRVAIARILDRGGAMPSELPVKDDDRTRAQLANVDGRGDADRAECPGDYPGSFTLLLPPGRDGDGTVRIAQQLCEQPGPIRSLLDAGYRVRVSVEEQS